MCTLLAVMIIPDSVRVHVYRDNLIAGMAMNMVGPQIMRIVIPGLCCDSRIFDSGWGGKYGNRGLNRRVDAYR